MDNLLKETMIALGSFLQKTLPSINDDWWEKCVINELTFQQQRRVEEQRIKDLSGLDLAALLRVLDRNWYEISFKMKLPRESRSWIKEMQLIHNRWAHAASSQIPKEDLYRDLDTIQRLLSAIGADEQLLKKAREQKERCLPSPQLVDDESSHPKPHTFTEFNVGQIVALHSNPSVSMPITQILPGKPENRYVVFHDGKTLTYYASQLKPIESQRALREIQPINVFHAYLTALQLRHPGISTLYSLHAARINFVPYQFRPVLKHIRSDRPRLLIADEVGVGKTIEAGLILRELQARRDINNVLIVCPKPLVVERKWQLELKRFDELFTHLDGPRLRHCIRETDLDGVWPEQRAKTILPFSLFDERLLYGSDDKRGKKSTKGLLDLDPPPHFDLIIVDEAHHLRNADTYLYKGVRFFCQNAEAILFLTATPIQLGSDDLFVLLNLLRPDLIIDRNSFEYMAAPNPYINEAVNLARSAKPNWQRESLGALREAANTPWGKAVLSEDPEFQRIFDLHKEEQITPQDRITCIHDMEQLHTFSSLISRTRRRDIGEFTTRKPKTVVVEFTPQQRKLHDDLLITQANILRLLHTDKNIRFMMTTIRRQAASCLYGLAPLLKDILTRRINDLQWVEIDETFDSISEDFLSSEDVKKEIQNILTQAEQLDSNDPKLKALIKVVNEKQSMPNNKILLFSSFLHTLYYLLNHLEKEEIRVGLIHGGTPDEDRIDLRHRFSLPRTDERALDVLFSSEVGCEGLDYQFCECLVNYDLPWNPMRVEQRIGRIDRYGQKSETVAIYNLITPGTVDADIYERCLWRIGVFRQALGGSEEILGRISRELRAVAENLDLTEEERQARLQQIADNEIRLMQEQEALEEQQVELFGIRLPEQIADQEVKRASSFWLSPHALQNLIENYLEMTCGAGQDFILGEKANRTMRLSQEGRNRLLKDFKELPRQISPLYREWERWLKGAKPHLQITFDISYAADHREVTLISPVHPLSQQAARYFGGQKALYTAFRVKDMNVPSGTYPFAIYMWQKHGIHEDITLQPVSSESILIDCFLEMLENADVLDAQKIALPDQNIFDGLDTHHHQLWSRARTEHQAQTYQTVQYRKESLQKSHQARITQLRDKLAQVRDEKIIRMYQSQIDSAEADFNRRMEEIEKAASVADISTQPVAFGVIMIEEG